MSDVLSAVASLLVSDDTLVSSGRPAPGGGDMGDVCEQDDGARFPSNSPSLIIKSCWATSGGGGGGSPVSSAGVNRDEKLVGNYMTEQGSPDHYGL